MKNLRTGVATSGDGSWLEAKFEDYCSGGPETNRDIFHTLVQSPAEHSPLPGSWLSPTRFLRLQDIPTGSAFSPFSPVYTPKRLVAAVGYTLKTLVATVGPDPRKGPHSKRFLEAVNNSSPKGRG